MLESSGMKSGSELNWIQEWDSDDDDDSENDTTDKVASKKQQVVPSGTPSSPGGTTDETPPLSSAGEEDEEGNEETDDFDNSAAFDLHLGPSKSDHTVSPLQFQESVTGFALEEFNGTNPLVKGSSNNTRRRRGRRSDNINSTLTTGDHQQSSPGPLTKRKEFATSKRPSSRERLTSSRRLSDNKTSSRRLVSENSNNNRTSGRRLTDDSNNRRTSSRRVTSEDGVPKNNTRSSSRERSKVRASSRGRSSRNFTNSNEEVKTNNRRGERASSRGRSSRHTNNNSNNNEEAPTTNRRRSSSKDGRALSRGRSGRHISSRKLVEESTNRRRSSSKDARPTSRGRGRPHHDSSNSKDENEGEELTPSREPNSPRRVKSQVTPNSSKSPRPGLRRANSAERPGRRAYSSERRLRPSDNNKEQAEMQRARSKERKQSSSDRSNSSRSPRSRRRALSSERRMARHSSERLTRKRSNELTKSPGSGRRSGRKERHSNQTPFEEDDDILERSPKMKTADAVQTKRSFEESSTGSTLNASMQGAQLQFGGSSLEVVKAKDVAGEKSLEKHSAHGGTPAENRSSSKPKPRQTFLGMSRMVLEKSSSIKNITSKAMSISNFASTKKLGQLESLDEDMTVAEDDIAKEIKQEGKSTIDSNQETIQLSSAEPALKDNSIGQSNHSLDETSHSLMKGSSHMIPPRIYSTDSYGIEDSEGPDSQNRSFAIRNQESREGAASEVSVPSTENTGDTLMNAAKSTGRRLLLERGSSISNFASRAIRYATAAKTERKGLLDVDDDLSVASEMPELKPLSKMSLNAQEEDDDEKEKHTCSSAAAEPNVNSNEGAPLFDAAFPDTPDTQTPNPNDDSSAKNSNAKTNNVDSRDSTYDLKITESDDNAEGPASSSDIKVEEVNASESVNISDDSKATDKTNRPVDEDEIKSQKERSGLAGRCSGSPEPTTDESSTLTRSKAATNKRSSPRKISFSRRLAPSQGDSTDDLSVEAVPEGSNIPNNGGHIKARGDEPPNKSDQKDACYDVGPSKRAPKWDSLRSETRRLSSENRRRRRLERAERNSESKNETSASDTNSNGHAALKHGNAFIRNAEQRASDRRRRRRHQSDGANSRSRDDSNKSFVKEDDAKSDLSFRTDSTGISENKTNHDDCARKDDVNGEAELNIDSMTDSSERKSPEDKDQESFSGARKGKSAEGIADGNEAVEKEAVDDREKRPHGLKEVSSNWDSLRAGLGKINESQKHVEKRTLRSTRARQERAKNASRRRSGRNKEGPHREWRRSGRTTTAEIPEHEGEGKASDIIDDSAHEIQEQSDGHLDKEENSVPESDGCDVVGAKSARPEPSRLSKQPAASFRWSRVKKLVNMRESAGADTDDAIGSQKTEQTDIDSDIGDKDTAPSTKQAESPKKPKLSSKWAMVKGGLAFISKMKQEVEKKQENDETDSEVEDSVDIVRAAQKHAEIFKKRTAA